jgi:hypothetical protein
MGNKIFYFSDEEISIIIDALAVYNDSIPVSSLRKKFLAEQEIRKKLATEIAKDDVDRDYPLASDYYYFISNPLKIICPTIDTTYISHDKTFEVVFVPKYFWIRKQKALLNPIDVRDYFLQFDDVCPPDFDPIDEEGEIPQIYICNFSEAEARKRLNAAGFVENASLIFSWHDSWK